MRRPHLIAATALGAVSVILILISLSYYVERPAVLRVAVASSEHDDLDLVNAMGKLTKRERKGLRIRPVPTDSVAEAGRAMERDEADLAIVRPDVAMPDKGGTVVLLHKSIALLVAPGGGTVESIADLAGKRIGLVGAEAGDDRMFEIALGQYDLAPDAVKTLPLKPEEVSDAGRRRFRGRPGVLESHADRGPGRRQGGRGRAGVPADRRSRRHRRAAAGLRVGRGRQGRLRRLAAPPR